MRSALQDLQQQPVRWMLRFLHLNLGLMVFGLSISMMLSASVGLGPWDVFHEGLSIRTPLTIGQAMILAGLALIAVSALIAGTRPGVGTVANMAFIGLWVDAFLLLPGFPHFEGGLGGWIWFLAGVVLNGVATGLYITAGLGAGPRDGFALALAKKLRSSVQRARSMVEIIVLASGWALGGTVGFGTLVFAVMIGPLMQLGLRWTKPLARLHGPVDP